MKMEYKTQQKLLLYNFLKTNSNSSFSIEEIAEKIPVGKSTIYRLISKMITENVVRKFTKPGASGFFYQFINCDKRCSHLHLKCTYCGKIFHLNNKTSQNILSFIMQDNAFSVDQNETILMGKCSKCNKIC